MKVEVVIDDQLAGFTGTYELDLNDLSMDDYSTIKAVAGVRGAELFPSLAAVDTEVMMALAVIACGRAGKNLNIEVVKRTKFGSVLLMPVAEEGDDEIPPAQPGTESGGSSSESTTSSGRNGSADSGTPETDQLPIGDRGSGIAAA